MPENRRIIRVFLASPGDLIDERKAAKALTDDVNSEVAHQLGYQVDLIGWEDTVASAQRPQALINRDVERCELVVGMLWRRWGMPPDKDGSYTSGFEEEFRTSLKRRRKTGTPEISLYFKDVAADFLKDPGKDLKRVLAFKEEIASAKEIYYENFSDLPQFGRRFRLRITKYLFEVWAREKQGTATQIATTESGPPDEAERPDSPLSRESSEFLRRLLKKTDQSQALDSAEVARFRLLSVVVKDNGNDEQYLGTHDANILFRSADDTALSWLEVNGLLRCALFHYQNENVPLWRWYSRARILLPVILPLLSRSGESSALRVNSLRALRLISEPIDSESETDRASLLDDWFQDDTPTEVRVEALRYLSIHGKPEDIAKIRAEYSRNQTQTTSAAADAIARIELRDSRESALQALNRLEARTVSDELVEEIFEHAESLDTELLLSTLEHPNSHIRAASIKELQRRSALPKEFAERLLSDSDPEVRYQALVAVWRAGRAITQDEAREILVKKASGTLGSLFSFGGHSLGQEQFDRFQLDQLRAMDESELKRIASEASVFNRNAELILSERHFRSYAAQLRERLIDEYKQDFEDRLAKLTSLLPSESSTLSSIREMEESVRERASQQTLQLICRKGSVADLSVIRKLLKTGRLKCTTDELSFMGRFGEWGDIPLVIDRVRVLGSSSVSLLDPWGGKTKEFQAGARTIVRLARGRLRELIAIDMPSELLAEVVRMLSEAEFRKLPDGSLRALFRSEATQVRRNSALMSVVSLSKERVRQCLSTYLSEPIYYYNVVHWLDMGVSLPRPRAIRAARNALAVS